MNETSNLDEHRGMIAQKETELRRLDIEVEKDQLALRARREEIERTVSAVPAEDWNEAVVKARYLLGLLADGDEDPRRRLLRELLLADFERLLGRPAHDNDDRPTTPD